MHRIRHVLEKITPSKFTALQMLEVDFEPKLKRARLQVESKIRKELKENVFNNLAKSLNDSNEKIAAFTGNMLYHFAKAVVGDEPKREKYRKNIVHEKENHFSETNVEMNANYDEKDEFGSVLKNLAEGITSPINPFITASVKNSHIKVPIPEGFHKLNVEEVFTANGSHRAFGYNYTNYFCDLISKYNDLCCYKFTRNFIRHDFSRKKRTPKFTVEAICQMKDCTSKVTIQQLVNFQGDLDNQLTIIFCGEIRHRKGDFQARRIIKRREI